MKKIFLALALVLATSISVLAQQHSDRTVETSGRASTMMQADQIFLAIGVQSGESCVIPSGRHYQKYIKECTENNKKLVATRENIMAGLVAAYAGKVRLLEHIESGSEYESYGTNTYVLYFTNYADYKSFMDDVKEYKDAFKARNTIIGCSKYNDAEAHKLKLEALKDARKKADDMCSVLGVSIDKVLTIYETNQWGAMTDFSAQIARAYGGSGEKGLDEYGIIIKNIGICDEQGQMEFSETCYLRFLIK
ncbi:MAG: hypothetical protein RL660_279 [Bacteroidota bacterium]|jgi:hypothetical protein